MNETYLIYLICSVLCFILAIVPHEVAHGFAAYKLGDPTAKRSGRLSLNPLKHVDPFGTVILPLMLMVMGGPVFGYAKPVPYNPAYFKDPRKGDVVVGMAGPLANLLMAGLAAVLAWVLLDPFMTCYNNGSNLLFEYFYLMFLPMLALINLYLMFFNLLPIPPLDGSSIFAIFIPRAYLPKYYRIQHYAFPVFMMLMIVIPMVFDVNPFSWYLNATAGNLANLMFPFAI